MADTVTDLLKRANSDAYGQPGGLSPTDTKAINLYGKALLYDNISSTDTYANHIKQIFIDAANAIEVSDPDYIRRARARIYLRWALGSNLATPANMSSVSTVLALAKYIRTQPEEVIDVADLYLEASNAILLGDGA